ncbi:SUKH-4 family immunity protein [Kitasatospora sp. NBC_00240]|uniref:SUKH-4 family immunity protein n=1 Tax=Kitasatospora sp. NBC_00240 TaxID=2903567 RepID=UPI0022504225|nr:SUKH-4 family immunity protein [Kitasatospora sp. NBC_00240]MCX5211818.1 SUKH-4 family immunity protein [Kitasatospora sp. NBC_00240]
MFDSVFAADQLVRIPDEYVPVRVTHGPSREYFSTVGFPLVRNWLYLSPVAEPSCEFSDLGTVRPELDEFIDVPGGAKEWLLVGCLGSDLLMLDGATGRVHVILNGSDEITPVHESLAELGYFLYVMQRERALFYGPYEDSDESEDVRGAIDQVREELATAGPGAFTGPAGSWPRLLQEFKDEWVEYAPAGSGQQAGSPYPGEHTWWPPPPRA